MSGIYLHIPFCKQACHYCNFHFSTSLALKTELVAALCREIEITPAGHDEPVETIYFGGGTPSLLSEQDLDTIFKTLQKKFHFQPGAEITLEANPDDITAARLAEWKAAGINRLSVGIQSFVDTELKWMNRAHNAAHALRCLDEIDQAGFTNFSVDLIYGSPLLTNKDWEHNTKIIFERNIPHISCYALTVEPATALDKMIQQHKKEPVNADIQSAQFLLLMQWMKTNDYEHYEISNFSKPGMRSKHNSSYWQGKKYYGFGPSAHSFDGINKRRWNISNNAKYIQSLQNNIIPFEEETLTNTQRLNEYIMTALRTSEGIDATLVSNRFGKKCLNSLMKAAAKYLIMDKLILNNSCLMLTDEGKLFADGIAADLFFNDVAASE
ncbi:MAG: radical SAM family heme chaperone HemW [Ferruginibacter sp.]